MVFNDKTEITQIRYSVPFIIYDYGVDELILFSFCLKLFTRLGYWTLNPKRIIIPHTHSLIRHPDVFGSKRGHRNVFDGEVGWN